ncbi:hypothetical protein [Enterococcus faecalis]|uniref:hypothetical protein n=1 Tax=Enterococcus faecalis TaxID=1351 RepID=UPI003B679700
MGFSTKQIKDIRHKMKNGKMQLKQFTVGDLTFDQVKEEMFQAALIDYLDFHGIKEDIHSFMHDALNGDSEKLATAQFVADETVKKIEAAGLKDGDVKKIKYVNKDAYDSPEQFLREEGLIK